MVNPSKLLVLALVASAALPASAQSGKLSQLVDIPHERFVLDNGLTLIVHEDRKTPIVAVNVWYHVGSKNEPPGRSGFAHLFEHLMFNGSEHFNHDYFKALAELGATDLNGTTNTDRTNYFQNVPVGGLDRVLFLESDRMGHLLGVIDQARLDEQRGVVQNEKRQGENQPYGQVFNEASKVMFPSHHPYAFPRGTVIGSMEDLDAATLKDVHEWFRTYYGPNNATIVIAGAISPKEARERVERYFGHIPAGPPVAKVAAWPVKLSANVRTVLEDRVPQARLYRFFVAPEVTSPQLEPLQIFASVLGRGKTSRLFERLVYRDQIATDAFATVVDGEIAGQFIIVATAKPGIALSRLESAIDEELAKLLKEGPTEAELKLVKTQTIAAAIRGLERIGGFGGKSDVLAESQVYFGDPGAWKSSLARYEAASRGEVMKVAREWLGAPHLDLEVHPFGTFSKAAGAPIARDRLPALGGPPDVAFPALQRASLKNGLQVLLAERRGAPIVDLALRFSVGTSADSPRQAGIAQLSMNLLDEGAAGRSAIVLSEALGLLGASLSTDAGLDISAVSLAALKPHLDASLSLMADVVQKPNLAVTDFERLRAQQLAGIAQEKSQPQALAGRVGPSLLFGKDHPYGLPMSGRGFEATVSALKREDVVAWVGRALVPGSATLSVVGDISMTELLPKLERAFGSWKAAKAPALEIPEAPMVAKPVVYLIDRPGSVQSVIIAGHPAPPTNNPSEIAIQGFNKVLGGDFNSRLNMNLREDKHWSYGVRSALGAARGPRAFMVVAPVQTDKTKESMLEIQKELTAFASARPVTAEEFDRAQADTVRSLPGRWETIAAVQSSIGYILNNGLPDAYFQGYADLVRALKRTDLDAAARAVLRPKNLVWIVVGDRAKIEKGIRDLKLGEVRVVDVEGNPVS